MKSVFRLVQTQSCPVAVVRRLANRNELSRVVPDACGVVWNLLRAQKISGAGRNVAIYWDSQINLEAGVELNAPFDDSAEVKRSATPAGVVVTAAHFGPYGQLHAVHQAIRQWCADQKQTLAGPSWEIYGHWEKEWNIDPSKIRADVFYLLKTGNEPAE